MRFDPVLLAAVLALVSLGLVMVYSSSAITAQDKLGDSFYFLKRQLVAAGMGLLVMAAAMKLGYRRLARLAYPFLIVAFVSLVLVLIPGIGSSAGGARRWIRFPGFSIQPAELTKLAWVVYLAYSLAKKREKVATFSIGFLPHLGLAAVLIALCMKQPDFGTSVALIFLLFVMLFAAGTKLSYLVGSIFAGAIFGAIAIFAQPYRMQRILAFIDPWAHRSDVGYQVTESLMSIGSGGFSGLGLGDGRQKLFFLPEAHTDFIFSIIGEELGLLGVLARRRAVRGDRLAGLPRGAQRERGLRHLPRRRPHLADRLPGDGEHVGDDGAAADQGADPAVRLLRRHVALGADGRGGRAALDLGERGSGAGERPRQPSSRASPKRTGGDRMKMLIAGGGTGGHLFPGIAVAEEVTTRHHRNDVMFVGTERGLEARVVPAAGFKLEKITARGLKGMGFVRLLKGLLALPVAFFESLRILRKYKPDVVVGVGGYASGPVVLAAWMMGIPTAVQEQNALPGFTNKVLSKLVKVVFIAFDEARALLPGRQGAADRQPDPPEADGQLPALAGGERSLRPPDLRRLARREGGQREDDRGARFTSATCATRSRSPTRPGRTTSRRCARAYAEKGFKADVVEFIDDMSAAYAKAELVICRAGATTLAELTVCKKAAILIPFPHAADNHQEVNAKAMVDTGAALMFRESELTGEKLADRDPRARLHPEKLRKMEKMAGLLGRPEAAKELADVCVELMVKAYGPNGRERPGEKDEPKKKELSQG